MNKFGNILWGLVFIILGLIFGGNVLGITDIDIFFDGWWTLIIIIPCFIGLFEEKSKTGNIIGLVIGVVLLLSCQKIIDFEMICKLLLPAILVIIGLSIIFKDTLGGKIKEEIKKLNQKQTGANEYCATFAGQNIKLDGEEFNGANLTAVFGGIEYDLRNAVIKSNQVINCTCIFGGMDIIVPEYVKIKVKSTPIFGGVSDKSKSNAKEEAPTIYVNATCVFGGVDIK